MNHPRRFALGTSALLAFVSFSAFLTTIPVASAACQPDLDPTIINGNYVADATEQTGWDYVSTVTVHNNGDNSPGCGLLPVCAQNYAINFAAGKKVAGQVVLLGGGGTENANSDPNWPPSIGGQCRNDNVVVSHTFNGVVNGQVNCLFGDADFFGNVAENNENNQFIWNNNALLLVQAGGHYQVVFSLYNPTTSSGQLSFLLSHNAPGGWGIGLSPSGSFSVSQGQVQTLTFDINVPDPVDSYPVITFTATDITSGIFTQTSIVTTASA